MASTKTAPEESTKEEAEAARKRDRVVRTLNLILACSVSAYQLPFQADSGAVFPSDPTRALTTLATTASVSGALEFLLCPTIGRAADTVGRRCFFIVQGLLVAVTYATVALQGGTSVPLALVGKVLRTMNYAMTSASGVLALTMFGDVLTAQGFVLARARSVAVTGFVSALAPAISSRLMRQKAGVRKIYAITASLAAGQVALASLILPETLSAKNRKPFTIANPFGFLKLFTYSKSMSKMIAATLCTNFPELKNLTDLYITWYRNETSIDLERFRSLVGLTMIPSGLFMVPSLTKFLGMFNFTTFANITMFSSFLSTAVMPWSGSSSSQQQLMYLSLLLMLPGVTGNSGATLRACSMKFGMDAGLTSGEYAGFQSNLKAIGGMVAPALYGRVYSYCKLHGRSPAFSWAVVMLMCTVMPEILWRSIPARDLPDLSKK